MQNNAKQSKTRQQRVDEEIVRKKSRHSKFFEIIILCSTTFMSCFLFRFIYIYILYCILRVHRSSLHFSYFHFHYTAALHYTFLLCSVSLLHVTSCYVMSHTMLLHRFCLSLHPFFLPSVLHSFLPSLLPTLPPSHSAQSIVNK